MSAHEMHTTEEMTDAQIKSFWSKVDLSEGCWLWTGGRARSGGKAPHEYGRFSFRLRGAILGWRAHRLSWALCHGRIPEGLLVLHDCDTPLCVNPDHLFAGTHADNMQDMVRKGRDYHGERHHKSTLLDAHVVDLRQRRRAGESLKSLAKAFGMSVPGVQAIACGRTRKNVPMGGDE